MCLVLKEDLDKMLSVLTEYVEKHEYRIDKDNLKDYLSDLKDTKKINYCGCDGIFEMRVENDVFTIFIEIAGRIYCFIIDENPKYVESCHSEAIPDYGDNFDDDTLSFKEI